MLTRNLDKAREAFLSGDRDSSRRAHESAGEHHLQEQGQYVKSVIYGGLDGIITTFAVVAGVEGAALSPAIVLILGSANLVADGISMAIGDFLSTRSEQEYAKAERQREAWEVEHYPEGEKRELVEIYKAKGLAEAEATAIVDIMARHNKAWVDIMMVEELGIVETQESPLKNAVATFLAFAVFGLVPLLMPLGGLLWPALKAASFDLSCGLTALTLFTLGALKSRLTLRAWWKSGLEMMLVGGVAAAAAYGVGVALAGLQ
jgi:VIT1/CCC1 family predicted Fe2+/Mn2+ transporter